MYEKLLIKCEMKVLTGMHIGGSSIFSSIGAVDSPVISDARTKYPIVPGSSLKGKIRTLLVRAHSEDIYAMPEPNKDPKEIARLFGTSKDPIMKSRLQFSDAFVSNLEEMKNVGLTEVKFENTIDRVTAVANPRQIERVISGVKFDVNIVYDMDNEEELETDMNNLAKGLKLLQLDYLGGHGTRGSGRVSFESINISQHEGNLSEEKIGYLHQIFKEVEEYELLSI